MDEDAAAQKTMDEDTQKKVDDAAAAQKKLDEDPAWEYRGKRLISSTIDRTRLKHTTVPD